MREIGIGLLGFGTVGAGVVEGLQANGDVVAERLGTRLVLRGIADLDVESDRGVSVDPSLLTPDAHAVVNNPAVDIVVELIGGTGIARDLVLEALALGKGVVTANKALLAEHGAEIFAMAEEKSADIYFGASVGGGIPIIRALREGLVANQVDGILGILNGTCNYILTQMETQGMAFGDALSEAQAKGFAEADPGLDIDGGDTAHKAAILAGLAYGTTFEMGDIHVEGIRDLQKMDLDYAHDLGYRIKLLAVIHRDGQQVEVRVHPTLLHKDHVLASVSGVYNAVMVYSDLAGSTLHYGRGAGREPTASTVLGDVADIARNIASGATHRVPAIAPTGLDFDVKPMAAITTSYYLRMTVADRPGCLAQISAVLGKRGISIASVLQKEQSESDQVPLIIVTHEAREHDVDASIAELNEMDVVQAETVRIRIQN